MNATNPLTPEEAREYLTTAEKTEVGRETIRRYAPAWKEAPDAVAIVLARRVSKEILRRVGMP